MTDWSTVSDTMNYQKKDIVSNSDVAVRMVNNSVLDVSGNVTLNGGPIGGAFDRTWMDDAYNEAIRTVGAVETPVVSYIAGSVSSFATPLYHKVSKTGLGSQTTNWDGQDDPKFSIQWGPWMTTNGGSNDIALAGPNKSGVAGYAWMPTIEFDIDAPTDAFEVLTYGPNNIFMIWVNGVRCFDRIYSGNNTIGASSAKLLKVQFPYVGQARRIKVATQKISGVNVPTGCLLTKPVDVRSRRIGIFGDSHVNGASGGAGMNPVGFTDSHAAYFIDAMHGQGVYGGVGGMGWSTSESSPHTLTTAIFSGVSPAPLDIAVVYASTNDAGFTQASTQAGMELGLSHLSAIANRFVVSTPHGRNATTYGKINAAAEAAAKAAGVPFISLQDVYWGTGTWGNPGSSAASGTAGWFNRPDGTEHMTPVGHKSVGRMVFRAIAEQLVY